MTSTPEPPYLQIGAQLEPGEVWAGVSVGHARMVLTCSGCDGTWILPPNVRGVHELAAMEEYHLAEVHGLWVFEPGDLFVLTGLESVDPDTRVMDFLPADVTVGTVYRVESVTSRGGFTFRDNARDIHHVPARLMCPASMAEVAR